MRKTNLVKLYDRFTPEERLRLVIEALAREDEEEIGRLIESCPYKTYTQTDIAFSIPVKAAYDIIQAACHELDLLRGRLQMIYSFQYLITAMIEKWSELETEEGEDWFEGIREVFDMLSDLLNNGFRRRTIVMLKVALKGLDLFCKSKFSLDSETLLRAFAEPYWQWLEPLQNEIVSVDPPPEDVADFEKSLIAGWNVRIGVGV